MDPNIVPTSQSTAEGDRNLDFDDKTTTQPAATEPTGSDNTSDQNLAPAEDDAESTNPPVVTEFGPCNYICGKIVNKTTAERLLDYLQIIQGQISKSLRTIEQHHLTVPIGQDPATYIRDKEDLGRKNRYGNRSNRQIIANPDPDAQDLAIFVAKESIGMRHITMVEGLKKFGAETIPNPWAGVSYWNQAFAPMREAKFKGTRNWFAHEFISTEEGDDSIRFEWLETWYMKMLPAVEMLVKKLKAGLADKGAWNYDKTKLSREAEYTKDSPEAEEKSDIEQGRKARKAASDTGSATSNEPEEPTYLGIWNAEFELQPKEEKPQTWQESAAEDTAQWQAYSEENSGLLCAKCRGKLTAN